MKDVIYVEIQFSDIIAMKNSTTLTFVSTLILLEVLLYLMTLVIYSYMSLSPGTQRKWYIYTVSDDWLLWISFYFDFFVGHTFISFKYFLLEYIHVEATISFSEKLKVSVHIARQYPQLVSAISGFRSTAYLSTLAMICVHQHSMKSQLLIWIRCILA